MRDTIRDALRAPLHPSSRPIAGRSVAARLSVAAAGLALCATTSFAQASDRAPGSAARTDPISAEGYIAPPAEIARLVTAPREANASFTSPSPGSRRFFVRTISDGLPTLEFVGKAHYNLGGMQVDYRANRDRTMTMRSGAGLELLEWQTGRKIPVAVPFGARVGATSWSPDGSQLAFLALFADATHIYVADAATGKARALTSRSLLATAVTNFEWSADGKSIITVLVPATRGTQPKEPTIALSPSVRTNEGNKLKTRTYPDLIATPHEKALLEYHSTGQLAVIDVKTRATRMIGAPGLIRSLSASPDGQYFRTTYMAKPFSYYLPVSSFGSTDVIIDGSGKIVREIANRPTREGEDPDAAPAPTPGQGGAGGVARLAADTGKRSLTWHPYAPGLLYAQIAPAAAVQVQVQVQVMPAPRVRVRALVRGTQVRRVSTPHRSRVARIASCTGCRRSTEAARGRSTTPTAASVPRASATMARSSS